MRALWVKAPFLLRRHPPVLAAVVITSALAALAAAASPVVRAGLESNSLRTQLRSMTPLAAGLEIRVLGGPIARDHARRVAAVRLGRSVQFLGAPVVSSMLQAQLAGSAAPGLRVVAISRSGALAHVGHLTRGNRQGAWVASSTATAAKLHAGGTLRLTEPGFLGPTSVATVGIAGIYQALEGDRDNPYWANWQHEIRSQNPDNPPPPAFVLLPERTYDQVARRLAPFGENRFEFPVDPSRITFTGAQRLDRQLTALASEVTRPGSATGRSLGCGRDGCRTSSGLSAALDIAASGVAAVSPTVGLLSGCGLLIALGLAVAAGLFLIRRRSDEAHVLFVRGESAAVVATRTGVEALLPAVLGLGLGLAGALLALAALAPGGTVDAEVVRSGAAHAALASLATVLCVAAGAAAGFPRIAPHSARRIARVPWEVIPLVAAAALLWLVLAGKGLAHDVNGTTHPTLAVFVFPMLAVAGAAGLAVRAVRRVLAQRGAHAPAVAFLALRRLAAARGLLVAVVVATATAFGTFAYAATLSSSLERSTDEKAYVSNGSDVQGLVDPADRVTTSFPFPVAVVEVDQSNVSFASGARVDLIAGDPDALARTVLWRAAWGNDPRPLLPRLERSSPGALAAIATPGAPSESVIVDQGARIPIRVVGHADFPGTTAGRPALVVARDALSRLSRRLGILDPGPLAGGLVWARGRPTQIEPVLTGSNLAPTILTRLDHIRSNASVAAAGRSYRYVRLIGAAAAVLSLVALLLYLQARQRSQLIASALARRMGLGRLGDAGALALEAAAIVLVAALVGGVVAATAARPMVRHVDSLPQYAPAAAFTAPWQTLLLGLTGAVLAGALIGAAATALAARADVAEALRVA